MTLHVRGFLALALVLGVAPSAHAQNAASAAAADALFRQGRELHEQKRFAEACPKFAESYRLDPATGSLLALASCHEAEGKLASAWAEYNETAARARREGQAERADIATKRAAALEPTLARLTINLAPTANVPGLQVKRDGLPVGPGAFGAPIPVDRGEHLIEANAAGHRSFSVKISVADGATQVLTIPRLTAEAAGSAPVAAAPSGRTPSEANAPTAANEAPKGSGASALRPIGIVAMAGGALAIGAGAFFGVRAIAKNADSNANNHCVNDVCDAEGTRLRLDARDKGNTSTTLVTLGVLLVGGGIACFIIGAPKEPKSATLTPAIGRSSAGLDLRGTF